MDLIDLVFDHDYFCQVTGSHGDWLESLRLYKDVYVAKCNAPNKEFIPYDIVGGIKKCKLSDWLQIPSEGLYYEKLIRHIYLENDDKESLRFKYKLFIQNLSNLAKYTPSDLEGLLGLSEITEELVLNAIKSNSNHVLSEKSVKYLEQILSTNDDKRLTELAAGILTNQAMSYVKDDKHIEFLISAVKREGYDSNIRKIILKKFCEDIDKAQAWPAGRFTKFASLLSYDTSDKDLAMGLFKAGVYHGYVSDIEMLPSFEKFLDDPIIRDEASVFIDKSLEKALASTHDKAVIGVIESHVVNLLNKTGKISSGLVDAIFKSYSKDQSYFHSLVTGIVAEDKLLSSEILSKLVAPLSKLVDSKSALFIATRLVQHHIDIPISTLEYFIKFLSSADVNLRVLGINLFDKMGVIPKKVAVSVFEGLVKLLPESSEYEYTKIDRILKRIDLTDDQSLRYEVQKEVFAFYKSNNLATKIRISTELNGKISDKTQVELTVFFRDLVLSQNLELIAIAKVALGKLNAYQKLSLTDKEEDLLELEGINNSNSWAEIFNHWEDLAADMLLEEILNLSKKQSKPLPASPNGTTLDQILLTKDESGNIRLINYIFDGRSKELSQEIISLSDKEFKALLQVRFENNNTLLHYVFSAEEEIVEVFLDKLESIDITSDELYEILNKQNDGGFTSISRLRNHDNPIKALKTLLGSINNIKLLQEVIKATDDEENVILRIIRELKAANGPFAWSVFEDRRERVSLIKLESTKCFSSRSSKDESLIVEVGAYPEGASISSLSGSDEGTYLKVDLFGASFLLDSKQCGQIEERIKGIEWDLRSYLELIRFSDIREIEAFLNFIKANKISEEELSKALAVTLDISEFYRVLLKNLTKEIENHLLSSTSAANAFRQSIDHLTGQVKWPAAFLFSFIKEIELKDLGKLIAVLEKLADYHVSANMLDRRGISALEYLQKEPISQLSSKISEIINDNRFYIIKDVKALLAEIKEKNAGNENLLKLIGSDLERNYFTSELSKVKAIQGDWIKYEHASKLSLSQRINKLLPNWDEEDFLKWRQSVNEINDNNIAEVIAVISQAAHNTILENKSHVREVQLISLLCLLKSGQGMLVEVATGEGKSLIIASFAIINAIKGRQVDIVTSSEVLAKRDAIELYAFYSLFGISIGHNIGYTYIVQKGDSLESVAAKVGSTPGAIKALNPVLGAISELKIGLELKLEYQEGEKECYKRAVVYGDLLRFIGDTLRDISVNMKFGRGFDLVIVDEADNMFIDLNKMKVQLSGLIPGFETLNQILVYMRGTSSATAQNLFQGLDQCYLKVPVVDSSVQQNIEDLDLGSIGDHNYDIELQGLGVDCNEYIKGYIRDYTKNYLFAFEKARKDRSVIVPSHLEQFVKDQLEKWLDSMITSYYYHEKSDYVILSESKESSRYQFPIIAPVDYKNTGVIQYGLQWSDGLHQFLQIKHGLSMYPENVVSIFMSYLGFFSKYKGSIYGFTGTVGNSMHHKFLYEVYGVDTIIIPTFIEKDLIEYPSIILEKKTHWQEEIINVIKRKVEGNRSGLIIVETITEVEGLREALLESGYTANHIFVYGTTSRAHEYDVNGKRELQPGDVIIATNMAGRGTDLKISAAVKKGGGLHVIMGMVSSSVRVEEQGYGRAARQGEPGSAQIIANIDGVYQTECRANIECLKAERDKYERERLKEDRLCQLPYLKIRDKLFDLYVELKKEVDSPTGYKLMIGNPSKLEPKSLYVYLEDSKVILKVVTGKAKGPESIDITGLLYTIDPYIVNHMSTILSGSTASSSGLNRQAYEIIHFISASRGYTEYPDIYNRVEYEFNQAIKNYKENASSKDKKEGYLLSLLRGDLRYSDLSERAKGSIGLEKVEIRKKYQLWLEDRESYNNQYEIRQITDNWGIWLKQYDDILVKYKECKLGDEEKLKSDLAALEERLVKEFSELRLSINAQKSQGNLMQNPGYLVLKAWQYFNIANKQRHSHYQRVGYVTEVESQSWFDNLISSAIGTIEYILSSFKVRISFGGESYSPSNPLESALGFLNEAIKLDDIYTWTADNAMSYISLVKNGMGIWELKQSKAAERVKTVFYHDTEKAIRKIEENIIPSLEGQLAFLLSHKFLDYQDDLAIQLIGTIEVYHKIISSLKNNMQLVAKSSGKEMIYVKRQVSLDEMTEDLNITAAIYKAIDKSSGISGSGRIALEGMNKDINFTSKKFILDQLSSTGAYIFEISTYELEEEKNWFGTLFAAVFGIASIATGLWMITSAGLGTFGAVFGSSMVAQGAGDIIGALISLGTGKALDFKGYINSKGMSIGISLATAGLLHFIDYAGLIDVASKAKDIKEAAENTQKFLAVTAAIQVTTTLVGAVLYNGAKRLVNVEDITTESEAIINEIIALYQDLLSRIYATDLLNGNSKLQDELYEEIGHIVDRYQRRFHDDGTRFGVGLTSSLAGHAAGGYTAFGGLTGIGSIIDTSMKLSMGSVKNNEAMSKISKGVKGAIEHVGSKASRSGSMLQQKLSSAYGEVLGNRLFAEISSQGYINNGELDYQRCIKLSNAKLSEELIGYKSGIVTICEHVEGLLKANPDRYIPLKNRFIGYVSGAVKHIQRQELVKPITEHVASEIGNKYGSKIGEYIHKKLEEGKNPDSKELLNLKRGDKRNEEEIAKKSGLDKREDNAQKHDNLRSQNRKEQYGPPCPNDICHTHTYEVAPGDNAYNIAKEHGLTVDQLVESNPELAKARSTKNGQDYIHLTPGQKLKIPVKEPSTGHTNTYASPAANDNIQKHPDKQYGPPCLNNDCTNYGGYSSHFIDDTIFINLHNTDLESEYNALPEANKQEVQKNIALVENLHEPGPLEGKLKPIAEKTTYYLNQYQRYEQSSPILAKTFLISGMILAKGLTGAVVAGTATGGAGVIPGFLGGLVKGGVDEFKGAAFYLATGDFIGEFIDDGIREYSPLLIKLDSTLTPQEAAVLASIAGAAALSSAEFRSFAKSMHGVDFSGIKIKDGKLDGTFYYKKDIPDTVSKVGPNYPRNAEWAGKTYLPDDLPDTIKTTYPNIKLKYPNGVNYGIQGFPDFSPYAIKTVKLDKFTLNNHKADYKQANAEVRKTDPNFIKPDDYTWHHHQDGKTMQLVPEDLHDAFRHTGGMSTTKHGVKIG